MISCSQCEEEISLDNTEYAACAQCKKYYHLNCCGISNIFWDSRSSDNKAKWKCKDCKYSERVPSINVSIDKIIESLGNFSLNHPLTNFYTKLFNQHMEAMEKIQENTTMILKELKDIKIGMKSTSKSQMSSTKDSETLIATTDICKPDRRISQDSKAGMPVTFPLAKTISKRVSFMASNSNMKTNPLTSADVSEISAPTDLQQKVSSKVLQNKSSSLIRHYM